MDMPKTERLSVPLAQGAYPVLIGEGLLADAAALVQVELDLAGHENIFIVTDENVATHYLRPLEAALAAAGFGCPPALVLPAGEATKNFAQYEQVVAHFLNQKIKREDVILALGGGVVGDIAGFAAATVLRGVRLVQVPTSLLAQVDSSVGGKTGINMPQGKNLLGSFYQPSLVLADTQSLDTLPARELRAGYAEVLKYALIGDAGFFGWLEQHGAEILSGDDDCQREAIARSCRAKADIVAADPLEKHDTRMLLNLGHTFGHALEALGGYDGRLLHGEAVAIGLRWAFAYSARAGLCPPDDATQVAVHLDMRGFAARPPFPVTADAVLARMAGDKKNTGAGLTLVLARELGDAYVAHAVDEGDVLAFLRETLGE